MNKCPVFEIFEDCFLLGCKIAVYLATGTAVIVEPDKGSSATAKDLLDSLVESEELALSPYASDVFSIWMASSFLGMVHPL
jgi:hypothetical protein